MSSFLHTMIRVGDSLQRSVNFYTKAFGMEGTTPPRRA